MLIQSLMRLRSRRTLLRDTFRKSEASYLEFLDVAEQCALRVSPEFKLAWQNVYRLQRLLMEQRAIRFEYLLRARVLDCSLFETLDAIAERLDAAGATQRKLTCRHAMRITARFRLQLRTSARNGSLTPSANRLKYWRMIPNIKLPDWIWQAGLKNSQNT